MFLVDSHCHLDRLSTQTLALGEILTTARTQGVKNFLSVSVELIHVDRLIAISEQFEDVFISVGLHPTEQVTREPTVQELISLAAHPKVVAIGETGLDYHHSNISVATQQQRFRTHIQAAQQLGKPLIIHTRDARSDTLQILREENAQAIGGVFHCFTEDLATAQAAILENFYISFSGILTFKNATDLQKIACVLPLDRILIETDSPYLAPVPFRGKVNQPAYVYYVAEKLADLRGVSLAIIAQQTTYNFYKLFSIPV
jgi:TatD DNase family protein